MPPSPKDEAEECEGDEAEAPRTQRAPVAKTPGPHASLAHTKRKLGKWRHTKHMRLYTHVARGPDIIGRKESVLLNC